MRTGRSNWGVVKAVEGPLPILRILVRWVDNNWPRLGIPEDWMWADEMRVIEKEPSK
jgi:hypothetical protein